MAFNTNDNTQVVDQRNKPLIGIVVNNKDPLLLRRVQLKIEGLLETDNEEALPWFRPQTVGLGSRTDYGQCAEVPEINTTVQVTLIDGDIRNGVYSAMPDTAVDASQKRAFGEDYPDTYGYCDSKGTIHRTNKKKGYEEELHHSGFYYRVDNEGNVHVYIPSNLTIHVKGSTAIQVDKNFFIKVMEMFGVLAEKEAGLASNARLELLAKNQVAVTSESNSNVDINGGVKFGVKDSTESIVPNAIKGGDEIRENVVTLQKAIKTSGELANETIQAQREALLGTRTE